jgi:hypothetical protein
VPTPGLAGSSPPCLADSVSPGLLLRVLQTLSRPVFRLCVRSVWPALCPAFSFRGVWLHRDTNAPTSRRSRAWWEAALFPVCARGVSCRIARSVGARTPLCMQRGFRRATKGTRGARIALDARYLALPATRALAIALIQPSRMSVPGRHFVCNLVFEPRKGLAWWASRAVGAWTPLCMQRGFRAAKGAACEAQQGYRVSWWTSRASVWGGHAAR